MLTNSMAAMARDSSTYKQAECLHMNQVHRDFSLPQVDDWGSRHAFLSHFIHVGLAHAAAAAKSLKQPPDAPITSMTELTDVQ